jgi:hypothetical protein
MDVNCGCGDKELEVCLSPADIKTDDDNAVRDGDDVPTTVEKGGTDNTRGVISGNKDEEGKDAGSFI